MGYPVTIDEQMLVSAVRYALGRSTYITADTSDSVRGAWPHLSDNARGNIIRDVEREMNDADAAGRPLGMDVDHRVWVSLLDDMKSGRLLDAPADDELGPDQGYPSAAELQRLASFRGTPRELIDYVESIWRNGAGTLVTRQQDHWGKEVVIATFITGGWSGCESVIGTLNRTLALIYKSAWQRGGSHSYSFPATVYDSDKAWDWELPLHDLPEGDGPYAEVRDRLATLEAAVDERVHELADANSLFREPVAGDLWALREENVEREHVYYFTGTHYTKEPYVNPWAGDMYPSDERLTGGRLLFRDNS